MRFLSILLFLWLQLSFTQINKDSKGLYYFKKAYKFDCNQKNDSAFYYYLKAENEYLKEHNNYYQARVLLNISNLQSDQNDLISCENTLIKALKIFKNLNKEKNMFSCYNKLGILLKNKGQFNRSQEYYTKALKIAKKLNNTKKQLAVLSNIAINYKEQKEYIKAKQLFNKVLKHDSILNYPIKRARAINYLAYCNFKLKYFDNLPQQFYDAKKIYQIKNHMQGVLSTNLFLAEFFKSKNKKQKAKRVLDEAINLAIKTKRNDSKLLILQLLSKVDTIHATYYFSQYTKLNDSLSKVQLAHKNQFARIRFETQEKEQEIQIQKTILKAKNKQQKLLFLLLLLSLITSLILLFFYKKIKSKNVHINNLQIEIRHRLKNNLAMVISFINKAKKKSTYPEEVNNYNILNGRVNSMQIIQELLYKNSETNSVNLKQVINKIVVLSQHAYDSFQTITINTDVEYIELPHKKAKIIGLIINELITNAYKYAFVKRKDGNIGIKAFIKDKKILILVSDDGIGFPKDFNKLKVSSYGLKLIKGLTKQLNGKITFNNTETGTETILKIPYNE